MVVDFHKTDSVELDDTTTAMIERGNISMNLTIVQVNDLHVGDPPVRMQVILDRDQMLKLKDLIEENLIADRIDLGTILCMDGALAIKNLLDENTRIPIGITVGKDTKWKVSTIVDKGSVLRIELVRVP